MPRFIQILQIVLAVVIGSFVGLRLDPSRHQYLR